MHMPETNLHNHRCTSRDSLHPPDFRPLESASLCSYCKLLLSLVLLQLLLFQHTSSCLLPSFLKYHKQPYSC
nr:MAG TPA: hypothetical protein [Caudoviricetes sp.]